MDKIKIGFEVTDNWIKGDFRQLIKNLINDDKYDVYLISNDDNSAYVGKIVQQLALLPNRIFIVNFTQDKLQCIINNDIQIYFDNLQYVVEQIDTLTDCIGICVTDIVNKYYVTSQYIVNFNRAVEEIINEES